MQLLRAAQHRRMAWKNGGGETTEIAVWPPGAGLDDFEWRISMARIASDGPFSAFAGVDRTLAVLSGDGLRLAIGDAAPVELHPGDAPLAFAADLPTHATLLGGDVTDLNVMTRRGGWRHQVERHAVRGSLALPDAPGVTLWLCSDGALRRVGPAEASDLGPGDAWLAAGGATRARSFDVLGTGALWRVTLERIGTPATGA